MLSCRDPVIVYQQVEDEPTPAEQEKYEDRPRGCKTVGDDNPYKVQKIPTRLHQNLELQITFFLNPK